MYLCWCKQCQGRGFLWLALNRLASAGLPVVWYLDSHNTLSASALFYVHLVRIVFALQWRTNIVHLRWSAISVLMIFGHSGLTRI